MVIEVKLRPEVFSLVIDAIFGVPVNFLKSIVYFRKSTRKGLAAGKPEVKLSAGTEII